MAVAGTDYEALSEIAAVFDLQLADGSDPDMAQELDRSEMASGLECIAGSSGRRNALRELANWRGRF